MKTSLCTNDELYEIYIKTNINEKVYEPNKIQYLQQMQQIVIAKLVRIYIV